MRFGERIRELRKAKNLSQRALSDLVGVSFTYISKVENEKLDFVLNAVDSSGGVRRLTTMPVGLAVHDISRDGRVLAERYGSQPGVLLSLIRHGVYNLRQTGTTPVPHWLHSRRPGRSACGGPPAGSCARSTRQAGKSPRCHSAAKPTNSTVLNPQCASTLAAR